MNFTKELRTLKHLSLAMIVFAALSFLTGTAGIFLTGQAVFAAEDARQASLDDEEAQAMLAGYDNHYFRRHLASERARSPDLIELLARNIMADAAKQADTVQPTHIANENDTELQTASLSHMANSWAGMVWAIVSLSFAGVAIAWVWRAYRNLEIAGMRLKRSAGSAIATFLIPLLNLVLPPETMRELQNRSNGEPPEHAHAQSDDVRAWFFSYFAGLIILTLVLIKFTNNATKFYKIVTPYWMDVIVLSLGVSLVLLASVLFAFLARKITLSQELLLSDLYYGFGERETTAAAKPRVSIARASARRRGDLAAFP